MVIPANLRVDCYVAVLKSFRARFPEARFEIIMRSPFSWLTGPPNNARSHVLSPSPALLHDYKSNGISWADYTMRFEREMWTSPGAILALQLLGELSENQLIFLVCTEKPPAHCHRYLVKTYIEQFDEYARKWQI
jgi:hypothetical protein